MIFLFLLLNLAIANQLIQPDDCINLTIPQREDVKSRLISSACRGKIGELSDILYEYRRFDLRNVLPSVIATHDYFMRYKVAVFDPRRRSYSEIHMLLMMRMKNDNMYDVWQTCPPME